MAENNFELHVSEPIPCEVDYQLSEQELAEYFDLQSQLLKEGKRESATMEIAMLGYALDFLEFAEKAANTKIDFSEESLGLFEAILEAIYNMFSEQAPTGEAFDDLAKRATGYFGVLILKNIGGNWVQSNVGMGVNINGTNAFFFYRIPDDSPTEERTK